MDALDDSKLTFGDLKVGDYFIVFPTPGDNDGHGGFLGGYRLFRKTEHRSSGRLVPIESGAATAGSEAVSYFPSRMTVVKVLQKMGPEPSELLGKLITKLENSTSHSLSMGFMVALEGAVYVLQSLGLLSREESNEWTIRGAKLYSEFRSPEEIEDDKNAEEAGVQRALKWLYDHGVLRSYTHSLARSSGSVSVFGRITTLLKRGLVSRIRHTFRLTESGVEEARKQHVDCPNGRCNRR